MSELVTLSKAADYFGVSRLTFRRWVKEYHLPMIRINRRVLRFDLEAVRSALEARSSRANPVPPAAETTGAAGQEVGR